MNKNKAVVSLASLTAFSTENDHEYNKVVHLKNPDTLLHMYSTASPESYAYKQKFDKDVFQKSIAYNLGVILF